MVVFFVLCKSVRGWKSKNYGLVKILVIRGDFDCKGRGIELGKCIIYWFLIYIFFFVK